MLGRLFTRRAAAVASSTATTGLTSSSALAAAATSSSSWSISPSATQQRRRKVTVFDGDEDEFAAATAKGITVVDFYADWCGPCKLVAPQFEALSEKHSGTVTFYKANVEENADVGAALNIRSIPTFVVFQDGKVVGSQEGALISKVEALIAKAQAAAPQGGEDATAAQTGAIPESSAPTA
jgi:thioredoxin